MLSDFLQFIHDCNLCRKNDLILMGISGGIDSMVMATLFAEAGYKTGIAHCNFRLRGKESDQDEEFVLEFARSRGIPFHIHSFATKSYAEKHSISIQMAARDLRYQWFEEIRKKNRYNYIALAHHMDDNIETIIFNLIRGTGLKGLTGMPEKKGNIIRPMLFTGRKSIRTYAENNGISWREDRSNNETKYQRNFIRHKIIPLIEEINPGFRNTIRTTLDRLGGIEQFIGKYLESGKKDFLHKQGPDIYIDKKFPTQAGHPAILAKILREFGFSFEQACIIYKKINASSGKLFYSGSHVLNIDRDCLIISPKNNDTMEEIQIDSWEGIVRRPFQRLTFKQIRTTNPCFGSNNNIICLDAHKLNMPLKWRSWEPGDWFIPLGMKGKKKLSDFMIDEKIPVNLKRKISVLLSRRDIVWVVGHRMDERFKITDSTKRIIRVIYESSDDKSF